ncbi:MAG: aldehyde dehydrogenase family protein [Gammaproteobacteria bacterium]|nr:aldehyde dehydrogenase family protein [Gammaproteobacteria bacterium]
MIDSTLERLRSTFESGRTRDAAWRRSQLDALARLAAENEAEIAEAVAADLGKCAFEAYVSEGGFIAHEARLAASKLRTWMKPRKVSTPMVAQPGTSHIVPEPRGVVLIIGAWNYPLQLTLAPLAGAIAAGNCAVLKPSELAPASSRLTASLVARYLDPDAFAVVEGGVEETSALLEQRFDHILYTGGERVARIVMTAAAKHLTPVALELGGKSPCIVLADADIEVTAARIVWGRFVNAGQTCVAPDYVLADRRILPALQDALVRKIREFYGEDPRKSADYGRIVNARHVERLTGLLKGQNVVHGGKAVLTDRYLAPTLVLDPAPDSPLMQEEIFGPILPLIAVDDLEAAIRFIAPRPRPLALYLFSRDRRAETRVLGALPAGNVCINDTVLFYVVPDLPFGGVGTSGMGRYHGWFGFETYSHMKAVLRRSFMVDPDLRYPPYKARKLKLMKLLG